MRFPPQNRRSCLSRLGKAKGCKPDLHLLVSPKLNCLILLWEIGSCTSIGKVKQKSALCREFCICREATGYHGNTDTCFPGFMPWIFGHFSQLFPAGIFTFLGLLLSILMLHFPALSSVLLLWSICSWRYGLNPTRTSINMDQNSLHYDCWNLSLVITLCVRIIWRRETWCFI